jgi:phosphoserine phosphatase RsbU/P
MLNDKRKSKILVVDDVPQNIRLLELNLRPEGYHIIAASNGEEALEKVKSEKPDLILLDVMMPGMDGYEVCRKIRQSKETRALPIVIITAYQSGTDKKIEALDIGADDFITKPFDRYEILARVRSLLRVKNLHDELVRVNNRLEDELMMAREVQQAFMPSEYPEIPGLSFSHKYIPTLAVGGDFFDVNKLSQGVVEIFISDVMGHGPQAAMITGIVKTLLIQLSSSLAGPDYLLSQINEHFRRLMVSGGLPIFVTAFCMIIDADNGRCLYSSAGHPAPFLIKTRSSQMEELTSEPGAALGMIPNTIYEIHEQKLESGDMLFFFTDGLLELMNREDTQFGVEELQKAIINNAHLPTHSFVEVIMYAADAFAEGLDSPDDITLLAVSYNP